MSSHFGHVTRLMIELCHKIYIILVSITRPSSTKNITCSNTCPKPGNHLYLDTVLLDSCKFIPPSGAEVPGNLLGFPAETVCPAKVPQACLVCL